MFPSFELFGKTITSYFIFSLIGIFAAGMFMCRLTKKRGENDNEAIIVMLFAAIGVLLGGHLLFGITNIKYWNTLFNFNSLSQFIKNIYSVFGGSVFYGGLIGGIIAVSLTLKLRKLNFRVYSDMFATIIPLFHCIARIGCFFGGCCYGIESEFGFTAHGNTLVPEVNGVSRFPVQLLEAALNLLLFFALYAIYKKSLQTKALQGKLLSIYLICYPIIRFFDEFLRGDENRGFVFSLSTSQFISILLFTASVISLIAMKNKKLSKNINI